MSYNLNLQDLLSDNSTIKWVEITDVYGNSPLLFFKEMLSSPEKDRQDELCGNFFAGMFHQEVPEKHLEQMMHPLLLVCLLEKTDKEVCENIISTVDYIAQQGLALSGVIGYTPLRVGFLENSTGVNIEMLCVEELRKHKNLIDELIKTKGGIYALSLYATIAETVDVRNLLPYLAQYASGADGEAALLNAAMLDFQHDGGAVKTILKNAKKVESNYKTLAKRLGGISLTVKEGKAFELLTKTIFVPADEKIWLVNYALLALYKESGFDWKAVAPHIASLKAQYKEIAEEAARLDTDYINRMQEASKNRQNFDNYREYLITHQAKRAAGWSEWPSFQTLSEYLVMDNFSEHLGSNKRLDKTELSSTQQALLDFLRTNGIITYMEKYAGWMADE